MVRNDGGKICGNKVATTLKTYATPVPIAISVNMLVRRFTIDAHPRWKNGQPPQSTTGVAKRSSSHGRSEVHGVATDWSPRSTKMLIKKCGHNMPPMAIASSGAVNIRLIQKRRV